MLKRKITDDIERTSVEDGFRMSPAADVRRPRLDHRARSGTTSSSSLLPLESCLFFERRIYIITAKIEPVDRTALETVIESNGGRVTASLGEADVIITRLTAARRLALHLKKEDLQDWSNKPIVRDTWVLDSAQSKSLQDLEKYSVGGVGTLLASYGFQTEGATHGVAPTVKRREVAVSLSLPRQTGAVVVRDVFKGGGGTEEQEYPITRIPPHLYVSSIYACQRLSPLYCVNEALVRELGLIKMSREIEGDERKLSYMRAIASIKALPHALSLTSFASEPGSGSSDAVDYSTLPYIGPKMRSLVVEYLTHGSIAEARRIAADSRFQVLSKLTRTIHGVGPKKARDLWEAGVHSMTDLRRLNGKAPNIKVGLKHWSELQEKISRLDVERIARVVMRCAEEILPGCEHTICGGYRRGKALSNDVDIVISHPTKPVRFLLSKLIGKLKSQGRIADVLYYTQPDSDSGVADGFAAGRRHASGVDRLDKAFTVFKQPRRSDSPQELESDERCDRYRRVDLIIAPRGYYGVAVVGWTGSTMFERDLRRWATDVKGIKFDSGGMVEKSSGREVLAQSEEEVFGILGLKYIPPHLRNADIAG